MQHATKPPARTDDLTVVLSTDEKQTFRRKCAKFGEHCSTRARKLINAWNPEGELDHVQERAAEPAHQLRREPARAHGSGVHRAREYPPHTHIPRCLPARVSRGGMPRLARF